MRTIVLFLILFTSAVAAMAQPAHVKRYYYWINQAELAICDSNYAYANECYDKAFHYLPNPPEDHLRIAYKMNIHYTSDTAHIYKYAIQLLQWGMKNLAANYARLEAYDTNIYHRLLYLEETTVPTSDTVLRRRLEDIIDKDQSYRHTCDVSAFEDSLNEEVIKDIYRVYADYKTINSSTAGWGFTHCLWAPCHHYASRLNHAVLDILEKEYRKGNVSADFYMDLEERYLCQLAHVKTGNTSYDPDCYGLSTSFYIIGECLFIHYPADLRQVNRSRKRLGISETYEDLKKKEIWQFLTGVFSFKPIHILHFTDEDDAAEVARLKQEIDAEHAAGDFHRMYYEKGSKASE